MGGSSLYGKNNRIYLLNTHKNATFILQSLINLLNEDAIDRFVGDKAYDTNKIRDFLKEKNIKAEIPNKRNRKVTYRFDKTIYKWRHKIENLFCKIKENRHLSIRFDKLDCTFMGFIAMALIKLEVC